MIFCFLQKPSKILLSSSWYFFTSCLLVKEHLFIVKPKGIFFKGELGGNSPLEVVFSHSTLNRNSKFSEQAFSPFLCVQYLFNCYLAAPWPTFGCSQGDSLANPMLITAFKLFQPKGLWEPCIEFESLSPAACLVEFEPGAFWFLSQCLNLLDHSRKNTFLERINIISR